MFHVIQMMESYSKVLQREKVAKVVHKETEEERQCKNRKLVKMSFLVLLRLGLVTVVPFQQCAVSCHSETVFR